MSLRSDVLQLHGEFAAQAETSLSQQPTDGALILRALAAWLWRPSLLSPMRPALRGRGSFNVMLHGAILMSDGIDGGLLFPCRERALVIAISVTGGDTWPCLSHRSERSVTTA